MNSQTDFDVNFEEAVYKEQAITEYKGNPLIGALPPILSIAEAYEQMLRKPQYDERERHLSEELRYQMLFRLQGFFQPVTKGQVELLKQLEVTERRLLNTKENLEPSKVYQLIYETIEKNLFKGMTRYFCDLLRCISFRIL